MTSNPPSPSAPSGSFRRSAMIRAAIVAAALAPVAVGAYAAIGVRGLLWLIPAVLGIAIYIAVFGAIGTRLGRAGDTLRQEGAQAYEALIVCGVIQSIGVVGLTDTELILLPAVGAQRRVARSSIQTVREANWFNGQLLVARTGFWIDVGGGERLGFAVSNANAACLRAQLDSRLETS